MGSSSCAGTVCTGGCVDLTSDAANCGHCGTDCNSPVGLHGTLVCQSSTCVVASCDPGYADCTAAAGCETPLSTPGNCGACGRTCDTGCTAGLCAPAQVDTGVYISAVASDNVSVYWSTGNNEIYARPADLSGASRRVATFQYGDRPLAVDGTYVYIINSGVWAVDKFGTNATPLQMSADTPITAMSMAADGLWVIQYDAVNTAALYRLATDTTGTHYYLHDSGKYCTEISVSGSAACFLCKTGASSASGYVKCVNAQQSADPGISVAANQTSPMNLTVDGTRAYWVARDNSNAQTYVIRQSPVNAAQVTDVATFPNVTGTFYLTANDTTLYYAVGNNIYRRDKDSGAVLTLVSNQPVDGLMLDNTHLYWFVNPGSAPASWALWRVAL
jgi:hypothetical protein